MTSPRLIVSLCLLALPLFAADESVAPARKTEKPVNFIPAKADPVVGDWQGKSDYVAQVFVTGDGKYGANLLRAFDTESNLVATLQGSSAAGGVTFSGDGWSGEIKDSHFF